MALKHTLGFERYYVTLTSSIFEKSKRILTGTKYKRHGCYDGHRHNATKGCVMYDVVVVGGGIVGVATARELLKRYPTFKIGVVEKEGQLAFHQTGHNSGVIHAGIYYTPGSLKAQLCVKGLHMTYRFCDDKSIPYKKIGKLIVATNDVENDRLETLIERGRKNNVPDLQIVDRKGIKLLEPLCEGVRAIWSPHTGIVDWALVTQKLGEDFVENGGSIHFLFEVDNFQRNTEGDENEINTYPLIITSCEKRMKTRVAVVCGGLQSDKLAVLSDCPREPRIIPVRGEYLLLNPKIAKRLRRNIYPVPDPRYPFLGVHFTPRMNGEVWLGPNAVLAFRREGYRWRDVSVKELTETVTFPGFLKLAKKNVRFGMAEMMKSMFLGMQVKELQKFVPCITVNDVQRYEVFSYRSFIGEDFMDEAIIVVFKYKFLRRSSRILPLFSTIDFKTVSRHHIKHSLSLKALIPINTKKQAENSIIR